MQNSLKTLVVALVASFSISSNTPDASAYMPKVLFGFQIVHHSTTILSNILNILNILEKNKSTKSDD